ncbi:MAG: pyridoxamine 5'-phosphate oxidase [Gammaproteobacteria bacterium]|jgi:pyridoxamine 5'-phosphate oxidase
MKITSELREQFMARGLARSDLKMDPISQFDAWYADACSSNIHEPGAMSLATVNDSGQPYQRTVLLKLFDQQGFVFFTNYDSRKAQQMALNNRVSILFPWQSLGRQVLVAGQVEKISTAESLKYFVTRPRGSQLGAWASGQSEMISSRSTLDTMVERVKKKYENKEVPLPPFWGGYRIKPEIMEFWQEQASRLHDRFLFERNEDGQWASERLSP